MKRIASLSLVLATGCSSSALAQLVPTLGVGLHVRRDGQARALHDAARAELDTRLVAFLSWRPKVEARSVASPLESTPSAWLAPCALDDATCLTETAEAEDELAAVLAPCALDDPACLSEPDLVPSDPLREGE